MHKPETQFQSQPSLTRKGYDSATRTPGEGYNRWSLVRQAA